MIGIWDLTYLAVFSQDTRSDLVDLADELEHRVIGEVAESEFTLGNVTGIRLAEHGVTVARNDLASFEGSPEVVLDRLIAEIVSNGRLHLLKPVQHLLVGPISVMLIRCVKIRYRNVSKRGKRTIREGVQQDR